MSHPPPVPPADFSALQRLSNLSIQSNFPASRPPLRATQAPPPATPTVDSTYDERLTATLHLLRQSLLDLELSLSTLRSSPPPTPSRIQSLQNELAAYQSSFNDANFFIPPADSPLNTLLAYKSVSQSIQFSLASLPRVQKRSEEVLAQLKEETASLREQESLATALESRLAQLEAGDEEENSLDGGGVKALKEENRALKRKTAKMMKELMKFVDNTLAGLLVDEEVGGAPAGTGTMKEKEKGKGRQRRIEEFMGDEENGGVEREVKGLLEDLLNASFEADPYVTLERESAAARFLVRARVAQFHRKDARKMKLVDFGARFDEA